MKTPEPRLTLQEAYAKLTKEPLHYSFLSFYKCLYSLVISINCDNFFFRRLINELLHKILHRLLIFCIILHQLFILVEYRRRDEDDRRREEEYRRRDEEYRQRDEDLKSLLVSMMGGNFDGMGRNMQGTYASAFLLALLRLLS